jgi:uncharacterized protein
MGAKLASVVFALLSTVKFCYLAARSKEVSRFMSTPVKTPCIGVCSTSIGDSVCRGCKRFAYEVIGWNGYSETERSAIMARIEALVTQVVQDRIIVVDEPQLRQQLTQHKIRVASGSNIHCLAYEAIRGFGGQLKELALIGCHARAQWQNLEIAALKRSIDDSVFELSRAHYERYFLLGLPVTPEYSRAENEPT